MDPTTLKVIEDFPIRDGLDAFRSHFYSICDGRGVPRSPDALSLLPREDLWKPALLLILALANLPAASLLPSRKNRDSLKGDLLQFQISLINFDDSDFDRVKPLLNAALAHPSNDVSLWDQVATITTKSTPTLPQSNSTSRSLDPPEYRRDLDELLQEDFGPFHVDIRNFCETFFGDITNLTKASQIVFRECVEGDNPLFGSKGWTNWPTDAEEKQVLAWLNDLIPQLEALTKDFNLLRAHRQRKLLAQPKTSLSGSSGKRGMDIGFVYYDSISGHMMTKDDDHFSHILVPIELTSKSSADSAALAWIDLATYARELLFIQDTRRFVLGFSLCGALLRVWLFDRLGGIASEQFDVNKDGLQFVTILLGFLFMSEEELGYDSTIVTLGDHRFIEIERNGQRERLILKKLIRRAYCISGRATTCWRANSDKDPTKPLVIKDSWQFMEQAEEGEVLRQAGDKGATNIAQYYHHETVSVGGLDDDVVRNVRKGLGVSSYASLDQSTSWEMGCALPGTKRSCSAPANVGPSTLTNRVHRRLVLADFGKPIYKASSRLALLAAFECCIKGHESLYNAGYLHRDISISNLMINEDDNGLSPAFLIDLDLAVAVAHKASPRARRKVGTRAFMAIGALLGEQHSFMHDLESFFWVLFWICIHYKGPNEEERIVQEFDKWSDIEMEELAKLKLGAISNEKIFQTTIAGSSTEYYITLIPWMNELRKVVFLNDSPWSEERREVYGRMRDVLRKARQDPKVIAQT